MPFTFTTDMDQMTPNILPYILSNIISPFKPYIAILSREECASYKKITSLICNTTFYEVQMQHAVNTDGKMQKQTFSITR
jgi:hypothetical protein